MDGRVDNEGPLEWEVLSNSDFWCEHKGALAVVGERGSKPVLYFSMEQFVREYPTEVVDAACASMEALAVEGRTVGAARP